MPRFPIRRSLAAWIALSFLPVFGLTAQIYKNPKAPLEDRVRDLFDKLTPEEKITLLSGSGFATQAIPRLDVPPMAMADAGQGVRGGEESTLGPATAFPSGVAMAATWDTDLVLRVGKAIAEETKNKGGGAQMLLAPAVNIHRSPLGGRNGESFSEDPHLSSRLAVASIQGVQGAGFGACLRQFAVNNQETDRTSINVRVGERAMREIYLPSFEAGVKEGRAWAVMSAHNKVNGRHASANPYLLLDVLKQGWEFDGLVMSDRGAVHETPVAQAGNDLEMPGGEFVTPAKVQEALANKTLSQEAIDDSVRRILRTMIRTGTLNGAVARDPKVVGSAEHKAIAREAAAKGIVLLKNEGELLPLDRNTLKSIAVIGEPAKKLQIGALGSAEVKPTGTIEIIDGIRKLVGGKVSVKFTAGKTRGVAIPSSVVRSPGKSGAAGFMAEYFKGTDLDGEAVVTRVDKQVQLPPKKPATPGIPTENFSVRWTALLTAPATGDYTFFFNGGDGGFRIFLDDQQLFDRWEAGAKDPGKALVTLEKDKTYKLRVEYFHGSGASTAALDWITPTTTRYADAVAAAKNADVAVVAVSTQRMEGEGNDRLSMELPDDQSGLIRAVATANPKTIVLINSGAPVTMNDWIDQVPAVLAVWFPGQEGGAAIAAVLFGDINPSGRLPDTFATKREDYPDNGNFPGANGTVNYAEGIYVGYRHFDKKGITPLFPFGHGLSYTTFDFANLKLSQSGEPIGTAILVSLDVTNTGRREGEEVVQLYIRDQYPKIDKPIRELKGFTKVGLKPGETRTVTFTLTPRDFAYFDVPGKQWKADASTYDIEAGASSRDIRAKAAIKLDANFTEKVPLSKDLSKS
jgi:beta-glucosidase